jgi:hypothetical protein
MKKSIIHLLSSILLLCACLTAPAQSKWNNYTAGVATNAYVGTNSYSTTYSTTFDVSAGSTASIQLAFKMATNDYPHFATNEVVTVWQSSMDGTRFTNQFTYALMSTATATNTEVWGITNFAVTYPWLKFVGLTNLNSARLTNYSVRVGDKIGL